MIEAIKELFNNLDLFTITVRCVDDHNRNYPYGVFPVGFDVSRRARFNQMRQWVTDTYGEKPYSEYAAERWFLSNETFWFKDEQDRMLFVLRWSNG